MDNSNSGKDASAFSEEKGGTMTKTETERQIDLELIRLSLKLGHDLTFIPKRQEANEAIVWVIMADKRAIFETSMSKKTLLKFLQVFNILLQLSPLP
jgi:hypothetical protein